MTDEKKIMMPPPLLDWTLYPTSCDLRWRWWVLLQCFLGLALDF